MPFNNFTAMAGMKRGRPADEDDLENINSTPNWFGMPQEKVARPASLTDLHALD